MDMYGLSAQDCFRVDDLLDFSNDDLFSSSSVDAADLHHHHHHHHHLPPPPPTTSSSFSFSAPTDFTNDLCVARRRGRAGVAVAVRGRLVQRLSERRERRRSGGDVPERLVVFRPSTEQAIKSSGLRCRRKLDGDEIKVEERDIAAVGRSRRRRGTQVRTLRIGEDAAVADGPNGPEDAVQRVRREIQIGPARPRVQARREPNIHADSALELPPEGSGAPPPEGAPTTTPTTTTAAAAAGAEEARAILLSPSRLPGLLTWHPRVVALLAVMKINGQVM
ncbi:hypothetical protein TIFTF001_025448 [Ficus carica]|uniref:Uncharacterized protein n=1 Tax=Ficus carica TaxID=3494 RepID=A0AA88DKK1_FICCA|nr:hypothetical protein TIFTF001_025448 [Ficus carica]